MPKHGSLALGGGGLEYGLLGTVGGRGEYGTLGSICGSVGGGELKHGSLTLGGGGSSLKEGSVGHGGGGKQGSLAQGGGSFVSSPVCGGGGGFKQGALALGGGSPGALALGGGGISLVLGGGSISLDLGGGGKQGLPALGASQPVQCPEVAPRGGAASSDGSDRPGVGAEHDVNDTNRALSIDGLEALKLPFYSARRAVHSRCST